MHRSKAASFDHLVGAGRRIVVIVSRPVLLQRLHDLVDAEARRFLPRWKLLERLDEFRDARLRRHKEGRAANFVLSPAGGLVP
jgi:hypothetical protein